MFFPEFRAGRGGFELARRAEARQPFLDERRDLPFGGHFIDVGVGAERMIDDPTSQSGPFGADRGD